MPRAIQSIGSKCFCASNFLLVSLILLTQYSIILGYQNTDAYLHLQAAVRWMPSAVHHSWHPSMGMASCISVKTDANNLTKRNCSTRQNSKSLLLPITHCLLQFGIRVQDRSLIPSGFRVYASPGEMKSLEAWRGERNDSITIPFDTLYKCLIQYKDIYNSTKIPSGFEIQNMTQWRKEWIGIPLGKLYRQMKSEGLYVKRYPKRKAQLQQLGYLTKEAKQKSEKISMKQQKDFEKLIDGLSTYKKLYDTFDVPYRYKIPFSHPFRMDSWGFNLGVAVRSLNTTHKYLNIPNSLEKLQEIGYYVKPEEASISADEYMHRQHNTLPATSSAMQLNDFDDVVEWMDEEELKEQLAVLQPNLGVFRRTVDEPVFHFKPIAKPEVEENIKALLLARTNSSKLVKHPTRMDTEKGYQYEFDIWKFEDVLQAMHFYNQLHVGNLEEPADVEFLSYHLKDIGFNAINETWVVPDDSIWPKKWLFMPLGKYLQEFRIGDIDAKEHWEKRVLLDNIGFNWGDGYSYLKFTWKKLFQGLVWWMYFRGHPFDQLSFESYIPEDAMVGDFAKPEEIQGLRLGYLLQMAASQEPVLWHHFPKRFEFLRGLGLTWMTADSLISEYKLKPHFSLPILPKPMLSDEYD